MTEQAMISTPTSAASFDQSILDALRESIVGVLGEECDSLAVHTFIDGKNELDRKLWRHAGDLGWLAVALPEEFGGLDLGACGLDILQSELGRHAAPGPFTATLVVAQALLAVDDNAMRDAWLPRIAAGEISAAIPALTMVAPGAGERLMMLGSPDAAIGLVPTEAGGWSIVELDRADISVARVWDPTRGMFDLDRNAVRRATPLKSEAGIGDVITRSLALAIASDSVGGARGIAERTLEYMKGREQFGRSIASFQALKHRMSDHFARIAVNEQLLAQGVDNALSDDPDQDMWIALAKAGASEAFAEIAADCLQLHGGVGFTWEYDPHIFLKRARLNEMLVAPNGALRDHAARVMTQASQADRSTLELPIL